MYLPKDLVSGDFYWFKAFGDSIVVAVADCTGHSLEGAMMTVLGASLLRMTVTSRNANMPGEVLAALNEHILETSNNDSFSTIGMEMAILTINTKQRKVYFSGAGINLFAFYQDRTHARFEAVRRGLGTRYAPDSEFVTHQIEYVPGARLYITTDGVRDQFGGDKRRKLGRLRLGEFTLSLFEKSMSEQDSIISEFLRNWQGTIEQTDDMTVLGVQLP